MADTDPGLLTIGQFSAYSRLSVRMLRYYDQHGVLVPDRVDPATSYRYYSGAQLPDAALVRSLRDVGFSVSAIAAALPLAGEPDRLVRALEVQRDQLHAEAATIDRRLADLERLVHSLQEVTMSTIDRTTFEAHDIVALRDVIPAYDAEGLLWERFMTAVQEQRVPLSYASCGAIFHDEDYQDADVDVEIWMPLAGEASVTAPLTVRHVPEQEVLRATHRGSYEGLAGVFGELGRQMSEQSLSATGPMFDRYLVGPTQTQDPAEYVTEVCVPIS